MREFLIERVKEHRAIWDNTSPDHLKTNTIIANDWCEIQKELVTVFGQDILKELHCFEVDEIKKIWQNLRTTFRKKKLESKGKSGDGAAEVDLCPKWKFFHQMRFLDGRMSTLPTHDSLVLTHQEVEAHAVGSEHQVIIENVAPESMIYAGDLTVAGSGGGGHVPISGEFSDQVSQENVGQPTSTIPIAATPAPSPSANANPTDSTGTTGPSSKPWTPGSARSSRKRQRRDDDTQKQRLEVYTNALKSIAEADAPKDVHSSFGDYVAARTREMDPAKAKAVQFKIMSILMED